jgi:RNA polymerase sigma factor (sigma-70 family)
MHCSSVMNEALTHIPFLLNRARRICRNEADALDLVQDTCLRVLEALERTETRPDNLRGWLVVIMHNHWISIVRAQRVRTNAQAELAARPTVDDALSETRLVYSQLARAWSQLPAQSQCIARQCLIEGDSQEEVSRRLGMSPGGVAVSIHRTRKALHASMSGLNP